jgi:ACS family hexuronate transporter-like MFS transporter
MSIAVSLWTLASAAHAFAGSFLGFAAARAVLGFGEGATFPGGLRTAVQTLETGKRSRGIAVAYSGGSLGAIVTPIVVTPIAAAFGWRGAFWFTGVIGAIWLLMWFFVSRRLPVHVPEPVQSVTAKPRLRDSRLWAFMAAYAFGGLPLAFVIYGSAIYLANVRGLGQIDIGRLLWIPPLGWETGYFFWGWISDRSQQNRQNAFRWLFGILMLLSLPLAAAPLATPLPTLMTQLFFAMFVAAGFVIVAGAGAGSWSAVVALVMPVFGRLFDEQRFEAAFALAAAFPVAGYALWLLLAARGRSHQLLD